MEISQFPMGSKKKIGQVNHQSKWFLFHSFVTNVWKVILHQLDMAMDQSLPWDHWLCSISLYKSPSPNSTTAFWQQTAAGARSGGHQASVLAPIQNLLSHGTEQICSKYSFTALFVPLPHNWGGQAGANKPNFV